MRWLRFQDGDSLRYGFLEGDIIVDVEGSPFDAYERSGRQRPLRGTALALPFEPKTFYAVGQNYAAHAKHYPGSAAATNTVPTKPDVAYRAHSGLVPHDTPVLIPADSHSVHYEGELVAVISKAGKHIPKERAYEYVLGYTIGNDVSERSWQKLDRTAWRAKNADTFSPMGPWIDTAASLDDMQTIVRVNGRETTRFKTDAMIFGIDVYISTVSQYITLRPGDMFWMGTEGASPEIQPGDVVEVEITGVGILRNPFVLADPQG
jgi:2-keto-4-pentenoate hydratase/2-oxohepta-3-ene-1,7-dioic acid hydratase in catechol pathway